jgi:hypothetical protein
MKKNLQTKNSIKNIFPDEDAENIISFGKTLRQIHTRLESEGYFIENSKIWNIFKCAPKPLCEVEL